MYVGTSGVTYAGLDVATPDRTWQKMGKTAVVSLIRQSVPRRCQKVGRTATVSLDKVVGSRGDAK